MAGTVIHVQRQRLVGWGFAAILATCLLCLGFALIPGAGGVVRFALLAAAAVSILVLLELERLTIVVTDAELAVGFRVLRSRTPIAEITAARPARIALWPQGIGVHFVLPRTIAFTARTGGGVLVARKGRRALVFSCDDPDAVLR